MVDKGAAETSAPKLLRVMRIPLYLAGAASVAFMLWTLSHFPTDIRNGAVRKLSEDALPLAQGPVTVRVTGDTAHVYAVLNPRLDGVGDSGRTVRIDVPAKNLSGAPGMTTLQGSVARATPATVIEAATGALLTPATLGSRSVVQASRVDIVGTLAISTE